ncbi:MAG: transglutaminase-like domain-containing protein [Thermoanaerobaculia bacterium]
MTAALLAALLLLLSGPERGGDPGRVGVETARYRVEGPEPWRAVRAVEAPGYRVALSSPDGRTLLATVEVDGAPLRDTAPYPVDPRTLPAEARALLAEPLDADDELEDLSRILLRGATTQLEAVERVVVWVSKRIRYESPSLLEESAASCHRSRRGSCVGRSLLAADLLRRGGIPVRQVTGILTARTPDELTDNSQEHYSDTISGVRHRWIEVYVPGLGWVPSDPGGLANMLTARHLALPAAPPEGFGLSILSRGPSLAWKAQDGTLARPRNRVVEAVDLQPGGRQP